MNEKLVVWMLGFIAGLSLGGIVFGDGGGGWDNPPRPWFPPIVPDHVPEEWVKQR